MKKFTLKDGLTVYGHSGYETHLVYGEVFATDIYRREGITISDGDCVFDIGANIGLFLISLARTNKNLRIFAFEPVPATFEILEANCRDHLGESEVRLFPIGISDSCRTQEMQLDGSFSVTSTIHKDKMADRISFSAKPLVWTRALISDLHGTGLLRDSVYSLLSKGIDNPFMRPLIMGICTAAIGIGALFRKTRLRMITCPLKTLSQILRETETRRIDLLKVDVEGAQRGVDETRALALLTLGVIPLATYAGAASPRTRGSRG